MYHPVLLVRLLHPLLFDLSGQHHPGLLEDHRLPEGLSFLVPLVLHLFHLHQQYLFLPALLQKHTERSSTKKFTDACLQSWLARVSQVGTIDGDSITIQQLSSKDIKSYATELKFDFQLNNWTGYKITRTQYFNVFRCDCALCVQNVHTFLALTTRDSCCSWRSWFTRVSFWSCYWCTRRSSLPHITLWSRRTYWQIITYNSKHTSLHMYLVCTQ